MKIKNMSKKQLRIELDVCDAMVAVLLMENDLLRETVTALEEDDDSIAELEQMSDELSDDADLWQTRHASVTDALDDVSRDLLALAAGVGVLAISHAELHG